MVPWAASSTQPENFLGRSSSSSVRERSFWLDIHEIDLTRFCSTSRLGEKKAHIPQSIRSTPPGTSHSTLFPNHDFKIVEAKAYGHCMLDVRLRALVKTSFSSWGSDFLNYQQCKWLFIAPVFGVLGFSYPALSSSPLSLSHFPFHSWQDLLPGLYPKITTPIIRSEYGPMWGREIHCGLQNMSFPFRYETTRPRMKKTKHSNFTLA